MSTEKLVDRHVVKGDSNGCPQRIQLHPRTHHIATTIKKVAGEKIGGVWMVDLDSLKEYEAHMKQLGTRRHTPSGFPIHNNAAANDYRF